MAFSASFIVGGLATYWIMNHSKTGFALDTAAIVLLSIAVVIFIGGAISSMMTRRTKETSAQAIERQYVEHQPKAA